MARRWTDVKGCLAHDEGELLRALAAGRRVLEIGSYHGRSTIAMAEVALGVVSVDHHKGDEGTGPSDSESTFRANLEAFGLLGPFDMAFVDGSHTYEHVFRDLTVAIDAVKLGGVVAWHDADYESVFNATFDHGLTTMGRVGNLAWTVIGA